eukprot:3939303-Rhodomonas_salina.3
MPARGSRVPARNYASPPAQRSSSSPPPHLANAAALGWGCWKRAWMKASHSTDATPPPLQSTGRSSLQPAWLKTKAPHHRLLPARYGRSSGRGARCTCPPHPVRCTRGRKRGGNGRCF